MRSCTRSTAIPRCAPRWRGISVAASSVTTARSRARRWPGACSPTRPTAVKRLVLIACGLVLAAAALYGIFGEKGRQLLERSQYPLRYPVIVRTHARNYDLDPALLAAVIYSESRFRPHVRSARGA